MPRTNTKRLALNAVVLILAALSLWACSDLPVASSVTPSSVAVEATRTPRPTRVRPTPTEEVIVAEPTDTPEEEPAATATARKSFGGNGGAPTPTQSISAGNCEAPEEAGKYFVLDTSKGCIVAKLYTGPSSNVANTIANFEEKASSGFFNGLIFHRVEDWVIQGGDPEGNGTGGGRMPSEYNDIPFQVGSLGVARGTDPSQNNDSQFFITKTSAEWLNGLYTNWGEVVQGMDVVNQIEIGDTINEASVVEKE
jgi:cyclophilin family peptidyl-prolyl cis-trans isomerase